MDWKIGEIRQVNDEWYQCLESNKCRCDDCDLDKIVDCCKIACTSSERIDNKSVYFKKLEKVGEPIVYMNRTFQRLKSIDSKHCKYCYFWNQACNGQLCGEKLFLVEVKKDIKEDMKENMKENIKEDIEEKILNLKPFDIQKAKEGKPVCTKGGRKARIICFDRNDLYPIVALIECEDGKEMIGAYSKEGCTEIYEIKGTDLMMLPEKKEGWVNIYRGQVYNTFEKAEEARKIADHGGDNYLKTIKIDWEE